MGLRDYFQRKSKEHEQKIQNRQLLNAAKERIRRRELDENIEKERDRSVQRKKEEEYSRLKRENFRATRTGRTLSFIGQGISAGVQRYKASRSRSRPRYRKVKTKARYRKVKAKARTSRRRDPWDF